jgi:PAS domain S-box-containing protein
MVTNFSRPRLFSISPGRPHPEAILAFPLRDDKFYYGAFWLAYDQPRRFSEEEVRYQSTLASQASIAAANGRLFSTAEIGRQRLEAILSSTPDPVLVTDHQDKLLLANPAACKVFDVSIEASKGKSIDQVIAQEEVVDLLKSTDSKQQTAEILRPSGQVFLATASTIETDGGNIGRVCLFRDITELKQIDTLRSEFVSTVSHDLRSPLALVRGYTGMLKMVGELNEQQSAYLDQIVLNIDNMSRLVINILDLRRMEAGVGLQLESRPIREVVDRVIESLISQASQKRVQLETEIPQSELPDIEADQALLHQALQNLVENSIKFTDIGGKVTIGLDLKPTRVVFRVRDTGSGISPADQARLFERFYRAGGKGTTIQRTSGLGLSIVKSIADRHKGQVWVDSQLGKGSIFFLELPLKQH